MKLELTGTEMVNESWNLNLFTLCGTVKIVLCQDVIQVQLADDVHEISPLANFDDEDDLDYIE